MDKENNSTDEIHFKIPDHFDGNIKEIIPNNVTHLTIGYGNDFDLRDCIPISVTHLFFGNFVNPNITNA